MNCKFCGTKLDQGQALLWWKDFFDLPSKDRIEIHRQYLAAPGNPAGWEPKLDKCLRILTELHNEATDAKSANS